MENLLKHIKKIDWKVLGNRIIEWITFPIRDNKVFFTYAYLTSILVMVVYNANPHCGHTDAFLAILFPLFDCYLFCLMASVLRPIYMQWIPWTTFTVITFGEIFSELCYHAQYGINVIKLVIQTDGQESSEFIESVLQTPSPWIATGIMISGGVAAWYLVRYCKQWKPKSKRITMYILSGLLIWSASREIPEYVRIARSFNVDTTASLGDSDHMPSLRTSTIRMLHGIAVNYITSKEVVLLRETAEKSSVDSCTFTCPNIVLIIGESFNKYHTPIYNNASLPTTPHLCELQQDGYLLAQQNAVTPSNLTSNVMHHLFTTWDDQCSDHYTNHTLFPILFRKAGYRVYFYSNQFITKGNDFWNIIGGTAINDPELSKMQFDIRNEKRYQFDGQMTKGLPSADSITQQPSLLIVHLQGQHMEYEERYPESFKHYTEDDMEIPYSSRARQIAAHYANATLYNDSVVYELWQRFAGKDVIGIYVSDHGEEVYDWRNFYERSDMDELNKEVAKYQFEIPMFFLMTDTFQTRHPQIAELIRQSITKPFILSDLSQALLGLAGIQTKEYRPAHDLLSPQYDVQRPRLIGRGENYDEIMQ